MQEHKYPKKCQIHHFNVGIYASRNVCVKVIDSRASMVLQNYQKLIEMTSYMIYIVAICVGLKCPRKIHLNTQCRGGYRSKIIHWVWIWWFGELRLGPKPRIFEKPSKNTLFLCFFVISEIFGTLFNFGSNVAHQTTKFELLMAKSNI